MERPNKAYQIAEPDNRPARVEWLSDTVEKEGTADRIASAPAVSARLVNSMAWLVEFEPAPAMTRARPPAISTAVRVTLSCLAGDRVEVSPAAPVLGICWDCHRNSRGLFHLGVTLPVGAQHEAL